MNAPKNRQSDDRNSHIASLALATPVWLPCACSSWPRRGDPRRRHEVAAAAGGLLDRRHQASSVPGSSPQANMPKSSRIRPGISQRISLNTAA